MLNLIALFFPSVISVAICDRLSVGGISKRSCVYLYVVSNIAVNAAVAVFKMFVFETASLSLITDCGDMTPETMLKYLVIAVPAATAVGFVFSLIGKKDLKVTKE